jgi:hypothetical protein
MRKAMNKKNVTLLYKKNGMPESAASAISAADENDLRLMLMLSLATDSDKVDCAPIAEDLGLSEGELDASIKYWCGAGLIKKCSRTDTESKKADAKPKTEASLHKDGKLERATLLPSYSSSELADLIESRRVSAEFIDEAQRVMGKMFRAYDTGVLAGIVDRLGFEEAAVLAMLASNVGEVVASEGLLKEIWGDDSYYNLRSMNVFVSHLRTKLARLGSVQIASVRGVGYKLGCKE